MDAICALMCTKSTPSENQWNSHYRSRENVNFQSSTTMQIIEFTSTRFGSIEIIVAGNLATMKLWSFRAAVPFTKCNRKKYYFDNLTWNLKSVHNFLLCSDFSMMIYGCDMTARVGCLGDEGVFAYIFSLFSLLCANSNLFLKRYRQEGGKSACNTRGM